MKAFKKACQLVCLFFFSLRTSMRLISFCIHWNHLLFVSWFWAFLQQYVFLRPPIRSWSKSCFQNFWQERNTNESCNPLLSGHQSRGSFNHVSTSLSWLAAPAGTKILKQSSSRSPRLLDWSGSRAIGKLLFSLFRFLSLSLSLSHTHAHSSCPFPSPSDLSFALKNASSHLSHAQTRARAILRNGLCMCWFTHWLDCMQTINSDQGWAWMVPYPHGFSIIFFLFIFLPDLSAGFGFRSTTLLHWKMLIGWSHLWRLSKRRTKSEAWRNMTHSHKLPSWLLNTLSLVTVWYFPACPTFRLFSSILVIFFFKFCIECPEISFSYGYYNK